jgi:tetratricopeptide (TPR) repeat protein
LLTAALSHWQGRALVDESRFGLAEKPLRLAARELAAQHKPGDPELADTLEALGTALRSLQRHQESIEVLERAKRLLPNGSGDVLATANVLGSLALSYQYMERPDQALETARRSLEIVRSRTGTQSGAYLEALDLYANLLGNMDRFPESSAMFQEVVEGYERMFGADSARTLDARQDLAATLMGVGRLADAERAARQCVDTYFRLGVQDGQNYANAARRLGRILFLRGDLEPSAAFLRSAYNSEHARAGENAFAMLVTGYMLARSLTQLHQFQEAQALLTPQVPASLEGDYPQFMRATRLRTLGELQTEAGDYASAHDSFKESARAFMSVKRGVDLLLAGVHESEGLLLLHEGRYQQAVATFREALVAYEKLLPLDSAFRQSAAVELAAALRYVGDSEQANALEAAAAPVIRRELHPTSMVRQLLRSGP